MNLLYVSHYPVYGGPQNQALRLHRALQSAGWNQTVLLPSEPGTAAGRLRDAGVDIVQVPMRRVRATLNPMTHAEFALDLLPSIGRIKTVIRERKIDLVVIGGLINPHAAIAAKALGVPVIWQILDISTPLRAMPVYRRLLSRYASAAMFAGELVMKRHLGNHPLPIPSIVYYPPVDTEHFVPSPEARATIRNEFGLPLDAPVVGTVANINPEKGIEYYVRAASLMYRSRPDLWFLCVGAQYSTHRDYQAKIDVELAASGIPRERFLFTGPRTDVERCYSALDIKLLTSISEATPTTVMEAMSCGVPVVATDVGAVRELVASGETGYVVAPRSPSDIAAAALRILDNPDLARQFQSSARARAVAQFGIQTCLNTHLSAFDAALGQAQARPVAVGRAVR